MALAMEPTVSSAQDADLMDIDIDMDLDDHDIPIDEEYQLEVRDTVPCPSLGLFRTGSLT